MPVGHMKFNRAIFDRWTPQRNAEFTAFMDRATKITVTTEGDTLSNTAYIYTLDHPDFLYTEGTPYYTFSWGKVLDETGNNYLERIISLHIQRDNYTFELVRSYYPNREIIHASSPSLR